MNSVFVLDAHVRHALVAIRSLASHSLSVTAGSSIRWNASRLSRYADRHVRYPAPESEPKAFIRAIERELQTRNYDMLLPVNEETVDVLVRNRTRIEEYTNLPFPPHELLQIGLDKRETVEAARKANIPHPKTVFHGEMSLSMVGETLGYPLVVKPRRGANRSGVTVCETRSELVQSTRRIQKKYGPVLFQEFIPNGGERGVYTLYDWSGELIGLTVQRRLRSRPPEGGASTYRETVDDPALVKLADKFLRELDWQGLAMVEFRIDDRTGEPQLLEVNPRLWGSLALSTYAGVDFPYLLYQLAIGQDPDPVLDYDRGVQARFLLTDGLQVFQRQDMFQALKEFLTPSTKPCQFDLVSARDPLAVVGHILYWGTIIYNRHASNSDDANENVPQSASSIESS